MECHQSMSCLMHGYTPALTFPKAPALPFRTCKNLFRSSLKKFLCDLFCPVPCRKQGCFIHNVGKISTGKAGSTKSYGMKIRIRCQRFTSCMNLQYCLSALKVRSVKHNLPVKTTRAKQGGVEHLRPVGCGKKNYPDVRLKPIHLNQKLIQCLLPLLMPAGHYATTEFPDGVNFINKDYTRGILLCLCKQIPYARCPYSHKHLNKF